MTYTLEELQEMMKKNGGSLDLRGTGITALPDNLTVGGYLNLEGCTGLTSLPDSLVVGSWLDLRGCTGLTSLPENLTVPGGLDLRGCTGLTSLPENLTVSDWLDLEGCTGLTSLPDSLVVGSTLEFEGTGIKNESAERKKVKRLTDGDYVPGRYLYADGILTHVKRKRKIGAYTYYQGKIKGNNVVFDGENYAHCKSLKDGVCDLEFKKAKERGAQQYKALTLESVVSKDEAITMYRIITGACRAGTDNFLSGIKDFKEEYTVREIVEITRGAYGSSVFEEFFRR